MKLKTLLQVSLLIFTLSACSSTKEIKPVVMPDEVSYSDSIMPFSLEVQEEVNDGDNLYLKILLSAYTPWQQDEVLLHLSALSNGEVQKEFFYRLNKLLAEQYANELEPGMPFSGKTFFLSIPSTGQSDYQLELLWGNDAKAGKEKLVSVQDLKLKAEKCEKCLGDKIEANLVNSGADRVDYVVLGVGFVWINQRSSIDLSGIIPENEEQIKVEDLGLEPGESTELSIALEEVIPENNSGSYQAVVRVVEYGVE